MESLGAFGRPDDSRCYWTILDQDLRFRYLDPVGQAFFGEQLAPFMETGLYDWIHPEERDAFERDYQNFLVSRTLFGTVTRCRYGRAAHVRKTLGASAEDFQAHATAWKDDEYMPLKLTSSWIGERTILCFFHAAVDLSEEDADESAQSPWSNWCGPSNNADEYFSPWHANQLYQVLTDIESSYPPVDYSAGDKSRYIFQLLSRPQNQLLLSYPLLTNDPSSPEVEQETAEGYAKLAQEVIERPREQNTDAQTNCTRRYRSKHPVIRHGGLATIESVVVPWGSLCFVGFEIAGSISARSPIPVPAGATQPGEYPVAKLPRTKPPPLPFIPGATGEPGPSSGQLSARSRWPEKDRFEEAISPTVANGAAILGSFSAQQARPPFPHHPMIQHQMPYTPQMQQPRSNTLHPDFYYAHTDPNLDMYAPRYAPPNGHYHPLSYPHQHAYPIPHQEAYYPPPPHYPHRGQSASPMLDNSTAEGSPQSSSSTLLMPMSAASSATSTASIRKPKRERKEDGVARTCSSCGTKNSPEWRKGPNGIKSLCNACGLRYARSQARKPKTANSPTAESEGEEEAPPKKKKKSVTPKPRTAVEHKPMPFGYESGSYPSYPLFEMTQNGQV